ncbi:MAG: hypothetical protein CO189_00725 [candidate division Zixibacteria bacterium CG_4_9_14_3_um_filter_46_8]|nr:MAG: hypothetical protein CO189_00725 [candidate division Zixibacteria bacterium CG_4_9_14_3_um_filter_46_8]
MSDRSTQLRTLYEDSWENLQKGMSAFDTAKNLNISNPLLLDELEFWKEMDGMDFKIMIFGQQTYGWGWSGHKYHDSNRGKDEVGAIMDGYRNFNNNDGKAWPKINSPFWRFCRGLCKEVTGSPDAFIWNNLFKFDQDGKEPSGEIKEVSCSAFPVITKEIEILKPNVIIFLTSQRNDKWLKKIFSNVEFEGLSGYDQKALSKVKHDLLPEKTYRTYHPAYLNWRKMYHEIPGKICELIKN